MRRRLTLVIAVAGAAPTAAVAVWLVATVGESLPAATGLGLLLAALPLIGVVALWYATTAARHLVGPLEALTASLRRYDPAGGDAAHPALQEHATEPDETAALKRGLRQAVERIDRDRSQKEAVLGGLMHDLKTPLVAQSLLIERLERSSEEDRRLIMAELRRSSIGAVVRLNRLIDVLRVDYASAVGERTRQDVRAVVEDVVAGLEPLTEARGVRIEVEGDWTGTVERDALHRALENVVANGVRHARERVHVGVFAGLVRVTDDGPGFARPFEELVDPFRAGPATSDRTTGTAGLGLYIARRSLESGGGHLKLESSAPGRTVVLLYLGAGGP
jgi:signal transduction histidine kinase